MVFEIGQFDLRIGRFDHAEPALERSLVCFLFVLDRHDQLNRRRYVYLNRVNRQLEPELIGKLVNAFQNLRIDSLLGENALRLEFENFELLVGLLLGHGRHVGLGNSVDFVEFVVTDVAGYV